jgi:hypothetical protein
VTPPTWRAAAPLALLLAACPLPQPLPAVAPVGTVAPPRIVVASASPARALVQVGTGCGTSAVLPFSAVLDDSNVDELVQARWFVDYDAGSTGIQGIEDVLPAPDGGTTRPLASPYLFRLADHDPARPHVVELVVSNGFYAIGADPPGSPVNRTPLPGYEVQVFRWTVAYEPGVPCP